MEMAVRVARKVSVQTTPRQMKFAKMEHRVVSKFVKTK